MNVSVIIATMNREKELGQCLDSVVRQTLLPKEIVIVDDGNLNKEDISKVILEPIEFKYHKKNEPSLSKSRNIGAKLAQSQLLLFLDDDVVLEPNYIEEIVKVFEADKAGQIGGVSGIIINKRPKPSYFKIWERMFCLGFGKPGVILPWGFFTRINNLKDVTRVDWIPGGLSCFRKKVFDNFQLYDFKEFGHGGRHGSADIEFSLQINKKYKLVVTPFAKLYHYKSESTKMSSYRMSFKQTFNQGVIFEKYSKKNLINIFCFYWAILGLIFGNLGAALLAKAKKERQRRLYSALGNFSGICSFVFKTGS